MVRVLNISCFMCLVGLAGAFRRTYLKPVTFRSTSISRLSVWNDQSNANGLETKKEFFSLANKVKNGFARSNVTILFMCTIFFFSNPLITSAAPSASSGDATVIVKPSSLARRSGKGKSKSRSTTSPVTDGQEENQAVPSKKKIGKGGQGALLSTASPPLNQVIETHKTSSSEKDKRNKLMQTGIALFGINVIALIFSGDDDVDIKSNGRKRRGKGTKVIPPAAPRSLALNRVSAASMPSLKKIPTLKPAAIFSDEDDDLFDISPPKLNKVPVRAVEIFPADSSESPSSLRKRNILPPTAIQPEVDDDDLFGDDVAISKAEPLTAKSTAVTVSIPTPMPLLPPVAPPKKNLLDRFFQKPGGGRPTDFKEALRSPDDPSHEFRLMVANALATYIPPSLFPSLHEGSESLRVGGEVAQAQALRASKEESGLAEQDAALAFAEVANAMLVNTVDRAIGTLSQKDINATVSALNDVVDFIGGAGSVYGQTVPGAVIEPVVYNGKAKKGDLESCYFIYLKECMSAETLGTVKSIEESTKGEEDEKGSSDIIEKREGLGKLQVIFNIKEGKRSSLEQKAMVEVIMSMGGGEEEGMKGMFDSLSGKGGGGFGPNMLNDMMSGGAGIPGMGDLENMNPEQMKAASTEAASALKQALKEGSLTKNDVLELEKMMGMDISQLVKMMDSGQVDKNKLKELGPEIADLIDVFKDLEKIKKQ